MNRSSFVRESGRRRRHSRIRKKVLGTPERLRLVIHRSHLHLQAQIVDDRKGRTIVSASTLESEFRKAAPKGGNVQAAQRLGEHLAGKAAAAGIKQVVFDRGGHPFHGRVKALAEGARAKGLVF